MRVLSLGRSKGRMGKRIDVGKKHYIKEEKEYSSTKDFDGHLIP